MQKSRMLLGGLLFTIFSVGVFLWFVQTQDIAILQPAGTIADAQKDLLVFATVLSLIVIVPVFALTFFIAWRYREQNKRATYRPEWDGSAKLETVWWSIPIAIIFVLSILTWQSSYALDQFRPLERDIRPLNVQVIALQWKWLFVYPDYGFATVNALTVPAQTPINLSLTSDAPMNSFWIPKLGGQIYTMAGMQTKLHLEATERGIYQGVSANISGEGFAGMKFDTNVVSYDEFMSWTKWVRNQDGKLDENAYAELRVASRDVPVMYFGQTQPNLFQDVIDMYMPSMNHGGAHEAANSHDRGAGSH